jgi:allantoicase
MDVMSIIKNQKMSKTKQLLDDMHSMDFYSVYADSEYWYDEWEKINRERVNNSDKIVLKKKDEEKEI